MANQVALIICVILLLVAVGVAIYFGVEHKKCKDSQDAVKEIQSRMSSDIQNLWQISNNTVDKESAQKIQCLLDGLAKKQLLVLGLMRACGDNKVTSDPNGKEICQKYTDEVSKVMQDCHIPKPTPHKPSQK